MSCCVGEGRWWKYSSSMAVSKSRIGTSWSTSLTTTKLPAFLAVLSQSENEQNIHDKESMDTTYYGILDTSSNWNGICFVNVIMKQANADNRMNKHLKMSGWVGKKWLIKTLNSFHSEKVSRCSSRHSSGSRGIVSPFYCTAHQQYEPGANE